MSTEEEFNSLLRRLTPQIADLMLRMMQTSPRTWPEAKSYRDEIVELNRVAETDEEQSALLFAFNALIDNVAERGLLDKDALERLGAVREADYRAMLVVQSLIGDQIDPDRLEYVTRREVEAGRLRADDEFRKHAVAGANALGASARAAKAGGWLGRLFGRTNR